MEARNGANAGSSVPAGLARPSDVAELSAHRAILGSFALSQGDVRNPHDSHRRNPPALKAERIARTCVNGRGGTPARKRGNGELKGSQPCCDLPQGDCDRNRVLRASRELASSPPLDGRDGPGSPGGGVAADVAKRKTLEPKNFPVGGTPELDPR
jgi:hypothetical protein